MLIDQNYPIWEPKNWSRERKVSMWAFRVFSKTGRKNFLKKNSSLISWFLKNLAKGANLAAERQLFLRLNRREESLPVILFWWTWSLLSALFLNPMGLALQFCWKGQFWEIQWDEGVNDRNPGDGKSRKARARSLFPRLFNFLYCEGIF